MTNLIALLGVLLVCGALGGTMGYYLDEVQPSIDTEDRRKIDGHASISRYLVLGIGASLMVPLFLNMISSSLVSDALNAESINESGLKLLVIAGFALVAAVSSRRFISSITEKVLREVKEAKEVAKEAEEKIDLVIEPEQTRPSSQTGARVATAHQPPIDSAILTENEKRVLSTLFNSSYSARAQSGIGRDAELESDVVSLTLKELSEKGLVSHKATSMGYSKWSLTQPGRAVANAL